jgi:glycosyltransferase involved in cell wall biosynthesis
MRLSVAICTWNRSALLDQTLTSFRQLRIPAGLGWEILIVDNNCTDDTPAVIAKHRDALPIVPLLEAKQGQSHARNCATDAATGEVIVWTDDDVQPDPDWLANYAAAFARHPDAAYFGGLIEPWYEVPPPAWIEHHRRDFEGMLVIRNLGDVERHMDPGDPPHRLAETPFGANMAIRTEWQRRFRYDPFLGKVKNSNVTADETDLFRRIREAGGNGVWVPDAAIRHYVTAQRMTPKYVRDYHVGQGQTLVRTKAYVLPWNTPVFRNAPRWMVLKRWQAYAESWRRWLTGDTAWGVAYQQYARYSGMIGEFRAMNWLPEPKPDAVVAAERIRTAEPAEVRS